MFDPATFDWGGFALAASAVLVLVWAAALWRGRARVRATRSPPA
jgi:hypothetical protein